MENWNFHGHIALPLEEYGKAYLGSSFKTANEIECGEFVNTMFAILQIKFESLSDIQTFVELCEEYVDIPASKITKEKSIEMFEEFKKIIKHDNGKKR